jgi:hypothetical protein
MTTGEDSRNDALRDLLRPWWNRFHAARPTYIIPITVLTAIYLAFELSFNARLLDVVGGLPNSTEVTNIEHWGRYISGTALALAIWGTVLMPMGVKAKWDVARWALVLGGSAVITIYMVYNLEGDLIDNLASRSSGATRQRALYLDAVRDGILKGDIVVSQMDLTPAELESPEGKSFAALFPLFAHSNDKAIYRSDSALVPHIRNEMIRRIGEPEVAYLRYREVVRAIGRTYYNGYIDGVNAMHNDLQNIPQKQNEAWQNFLAGLHGMAPENVPAGMLPQIRSRLQSQGIAVADDWSPADRAGFDAAVEAHIRASETQAYQDSVHKQFGPDVSLPLDLSQDAFFAQPAVQKIMRAKFDLPDDVTLPGVVDDLTFINTFYYPLVEKQTDCEMKVFRASPALLENGGAFEERGKDQMRALLVPPIALAFSLIGALVHITKITNYSLRIIVNRSWLNIRTIGAGVAAIGLCAFFASNAVTASSGFQSMKHDTRQTLGPFIAESFTWVIKAQPFAYPFDEGVRKHILGGYQFGYPDPHIPNPPPDPCFPTPGA